MPVHHAQHISYKSDSEDVISIGEEADTSDHDSANMVPSKRRVINIGKSTSSTFIGVVDVSMVVVEVMEGRVAASRPVRHDEGGPAGRITTQMQDVGGRVV